MSKNILPEIAKMLDVEMYEKFKKLSDKNTDAYEKRQKEIDKLYRE